MRRLLLSAVVTIAFVSRPSSVDGAIQLITNGDFSAGLAGWTVFDQAGSFVPGGWFSSTVGTATPVSAFPTSAVNGAGATAAGGYAVTDQGGAGTHALIQSFLVPSPALSVILSFDMFVNDQSGAGPVVDPAGLDFTVAANQHGRVDILVFGSPPLDTGAGVLGNFYTGNDPFGSNPNPFTHYSFDITGIVGAGGTFDLRFAEVDNLLFFNMGVDNVSVMFEPVNGGAVPEPLSLMVWMALAGIALHVGRRGCPGLP
jgi:hypothetical protein